MEVRTHRVSVSSRAGMQIIDITGRIRTALLETGLTDGTMTVFVPGSTGGVTTVEYEPGLLEDLPEFFERLAPSNRSYHHDMTWHDGNGHSHVRASFLGPSLTIPFCDGEFTLGTWQQVVFVDFDVPARKRELVLQFMGQ